VKFRIEKSFDKDIDGIKDKKLLRKLQAFISTIENVDTIQEIPAFLPVVIDSMTAFLHLCAFALSWSSLCV